MKTILITDTHFGTRQNSMTWLNSQMDFIYNQLIPYIKRQDKVKLIHLGDVFDSRSTISTMVASKVVEAFKEITKYVDKFIIIGGNHDFYSPNSDEVDTLNLLLGNLDIDIITKGMKIDGYNLYVPWYQWHENPQCIQDLIDTHKIKRLFTHADIVNEPVNIYCREIYSGHIHIPYCKGNIKNLGSTYPLNFADSNAPRGFYVIHEDDKLEFIENKESIKFYRLYNEDLFTDRKWNKNDYIELYITQANLSNPKYIDRINDIVKNWKNVWIIPQVEHINTFDEKTFEGYDIESITRDMIPDDLKNKFDKILSYQI